MFSVDSHLIQLSENPLSLINSSNRCSTVKIWAGKGLGYCCVCSRNIHHMPTLLNSAMSLSSCFNINVNRLMLCCVYVVLARCSTQMFDVVYIIHLRVLNI